MRKVKKELSWYECAMGMEYPLKVMVSPNVVPIVWGNDNHDDDDEMLTALVGGRVHEVSMGG